jgi:glycosyltransferase involved in cell wall biosynthesis
VVQAEILVNDESHGLARLGMPRPDVAEVRASDFAVVAGFEHFVDLSNLPADDREVTIHAVVTDLTGACRATIRRSWPLIEESVPPTSAADLAPASMARTRRERRARVAAARASTLALVTDFDTAPASRLHLLAFTHELGLGGGQLWLFELLERSRAGRDYECTVVAEKGGALHGELERLGVNVHVTAGFPTGDAESYEGRIRELAVLAQRWNTNAVLANTMSSFPGADVADRLGLPCVWAIHESYPPSSFWSVGYPPNGVDPLVRSRVEELLVSTPAVVFEAEATRQLYLEVVPPDHALVVPYGINTAKIERYLSTVTRDSARRRHDLGPGQRVLLTMGTTEPRKSQTVLAEAFAHIAADHPEALLVFVGDNGTDYARSLRRFIERSGVASQIRLEPVTADTYSWYRAADVLVSSSDIESLPRSFLEAMCFGLPIAAASVFGVPELIEDGRTGFLFEPRKLTAMIDALRRVLEADGLALSKVAAAARARAPEFDSLGYATRLTELLRRLASAREPSEAGGRPRHN